MSCKSCSCKSGKAMVSQTPVFDNDLKRRKRESLKTVIWAAKKKKVKYL